MQLVQLVTMRSQFRQGDRHVSQFSAVALGKVPAGQLEASTQVKLVKKLIAHEVHRVYVSQLRHGL